MVADSHLPIPELVMCRCVFISPLGRIVYPLWWSSLTKDLQTEPNKDVLRRCNWTDAESLVDKFE